MSSTEEKIKDTPRFDLIKPVTSPKNNVIRFNLAELNDSAINLQQDRASVRNPNAMSPAPEIGISKLSISPNKFTMPRESNELAPPFNCFYDNKSAVSQIDWKDRISPSARTENRDPVQGGGTFLFNAVNTNKFKKKKDKQKVKKNVSAAKA